MPGSDSAYTASDSVIEYDSESEQPVPVPDEVGNVDSDSYNIIRTNEGPGPDVPLADAEADAPNGKSTD